MGWHGLAGPAWADLGQSRGQGTDKEGMDATFSLRLAPCSLAPETGYHFEARQMPQHVGPYCVARSTEYDYTVQVVGPEPEPEP